MTRRLAAAIERRRNLIRAAFFVYVLALFTATHWPAWEVRIPMVERPDLIAHFTVFGVWFFLLWGSGFVGAPISHRSVGIAMLVSWAYAGIDEGLQGIPWVRRHCAWDDFFANCIGIALAAAVASFFVYLVRRGATRT